LLAFLTLACLQKQAFDAARIKKACHFVTGFVIRIGLLNCIPIIYK
jgi:hypothetical protein